MINFLTDLPWPVIFVIGMLLGLLLGFYIFGKERKDGVIHVTQGEEKDKYLFEFNIPPEKIPRMKNVVFGVDIIEDHTQQ